MAVFRLPSTISRKSVSRFRLGPPFSEVTSVSVEKSPGDEYACPATNVVVATHEPSGESRVRLGTPASGSSRRIAQFASSTSAWKVVTKLGFENRQTAPSRRA
ncbi:hypothetical protein GCM10010168_82940 [Actinoplanes ianthinogenes]|nr:hypothetical protein GCM10010168_82940 [Actinoplanes ianthinogenes]